MTHDIWKTQSFESGITADAPHFTYKPVNELDNRLRVHH